MNSEPVIDMMSVVREEYPELFIKSGRVRKAEPKKFWCQCGEQFSKTKTFTTMIAKFAVPICPKCKERGMKRDAHIVWKRLVVNQIVHEDFILNFILEAGKPVRKEEVYAALAEEFGTNDFRALGALVYQGYLNVDLDKRDQYGIVEYTINHKKDLQRRYDIQM